MAKAKRKTSSSRAKDQGKEPSNEQPQKYDETFKKWITQQVDEIMPILVTDMEYELELNVEFSRSMMRADKVFQVRHHGRSYILNIEFQVGADKHLPSRLLLYNSALYHKYHLPVRSMVIYPFEVKMSVPPLVISNSENDIISFNYETVPLFLMNAEQYMHNHQTCMYPLLPTMRGFHADMAVQAMGELSELYGDDRKALTEQFIWMQLCLNRTRTIELPEKIHIRERLSMFDQLWEEDPTIQKMRAEYLMKGVQKGRQEELQRLQQMLMNIVRAKYPDFVDLAQQKASHIDNPDKFQFLIEHVVSAPNVDTVRWLLEPKTL